MKVIKLKRTHQLPSYLLALKFLFGMFLLLGFPIFFESLKMILIDGEILMLFGVIIGLGMIIYGYFELAMILSFTKSIIIVDSNNFKKVTTNNQLAKLFVTKSIENQYSLGDVTAVITIENSNARQTIIDLCQYDKQYKLEIEGRANPLYLRDIGLFSFNVFSPKVTRRESIRTQIKNTVYNKKYEQVQHGYLTVVELIDGTIVPITINSKLQAANNVSKQVGLELGAPVIKCSAQQQRDMMQAYLQMIKKSNR